MKSIIVALLVLGLAAGSASASPPIHHPPIHPPVYAPVHPPVRPPVINRPPTIPNRAIQDQRRLRESISRRREEALVLTPTETEAIDDPKIWEDVADLTLVDLIALFGDLEPEVTGLDSEALDAAKARVKADLEGSGRSHGQVLDGIRMVEGTFAWIEGQARDSTNNYSLDVAREFERIYAANCCGEAEFTRALGDARAAVANQFVADMTASLNHESRSTGMTFNVHVSAAYDANAASDGNNQVVQGVRAIGRERGADTQVASNTPAGGETPPTAPKAPPAPPVQPENTGPLANSTPTLRETVGPSPQAGQSGAPASGGSSSAQVTGGSPPPAPTPTADSNSSSGTPSDRPPVLRVAPPTVVENISPGDLLTAIPTGPGNHPASPASGYGGAIDTTSVASTRVQGSGRPAITPPTRGGPTLTSEVAGAVGTAIWNGVHVVASWMDDHNLLGGDRSRPPRFEGRTLFHGIGNGAFEGRYGIQMTPETVGPGGVVRGTNVGGGLVQ